MLCPAVQAPYMRPMSSIRPWRTIERRASRQIMVGSVPVGGDAPVSVQTMTNTLTSDAAAKAAWRKESPGISKDAKQLGESRGCV